MPPTLLRWEGRWREVGTKEREAAGSVLALPEGIATAVWSLQKLGGQGVVARARTGEWVKR